MQSLPRMRGQEEPGDFDSLSPAEMSLPKRPFGDNSVWLETQRHGHVHRYPIRDGEFLIGRGRHCHLTLNAERRFVSREHASITSSDGTYSITDLSINGTWLNGVRLTRLRQTSLQPGDVITIENWELTFRMSPSDGASSD